MDSSVSSKDETWFLRVCHHISNAVYLPNELRLLLCYDIFLDRNVYHAKENDAFSFCVTRLLIMTRKLLETSLHE